MPALAQNFHIDLGGEVALYEMGLPLRHGFGVGLRNAGVGEPADGRVGVVDGCRTLIHGRAVNLLRPLWEDAERLVQPTAKLPSTRSMRPLVGARFRSAR